MCNCHCNWVFLSESSLSKVLDAWYIKIYFVLFLGTVRDNQTSSLFMSNRAGDIGLKIATSNTWIKPSRISISPLYSSRLPTYTAMFCVLKTANCGDSLLSTACEQYLLFVMTSVFVLLTSSYDNFTLMTKLVSLFCQYRYILLLKIAEPCARQRLLNIWKMFEYSSKLAETRFYG